MVKIIYSFYIDIPEKELDFFDKNIIKVYILCAPLKI